MVIVIVIVMLMVQEGVLTFVLIPWPISQPLWLTTRDPSDLFTPICTPASYPDQPIPYLRRGERKGEERRGKERGQPLIVGQGNHR
jgi:hypothetical protein